MASDETALLRRRVEDWMEAPILGHGLYARYQDARDLIRDLWSVIGDERHIVDYRVDGWSIQHPLECRPAMLDCTIHEAVDAEANGYGDLNLAEWGRWVVEGVDDAGRPIYGASLDGWESA